MLFYVKKFLWLDLAVTLILGAFGFWGIKHFSVPYNFALTLASCLQGLASFVAIMSWTFAVQKGYAIVRGKEYAEALTDALAKEYIGTSSVHATFGGLTAAFGEELFFRGFIQGEWGLSAASLAFGLAHFGRKISGL